MVDCGEVRLSILEAGEGGIPLLLVHGFTGAKEDFRDEVDRLAEVGYWVVAPDHRGHGASSQPEDEDAYALSAYVDDMWALAGQLGWDRLHLLGHSMGGMIAQLMVLGHPDRIDRLVLMDTHHGPVDDIDRDVVQLGIELARTEGLKVIQDVLKLAAKPEEQAAYLRTCAERPGYAEWSDSKMLACSPAMYAAMLGQLLDVEDRLEHLAALEVPTLVIVGEWDRSFTEPSRRMAATIPGAQLVVLPEAGHSPQFEATEAWRDAIDAFLSA